MFSARRLSWSAALLLASSPSLQATSISRLTFEQLTDSSEVIASGHVTQSWSSWDSEHKYIWTHYRLSVREIIKGSHFTTVEFAEPGGAVDDASLLVAGSVRYEVGESALVFLSRMPNGYLRTTGWAQGKYTVDSSDRLHGAALIGAEFIAIENAPVGWSLRTLEGMSIEVLRQRVSARAGAGSGRAR